MDDLLVAFIESFSYFGIWVIVLIETGLLLGFFLPGDTLLITVGLLAAAGKLDLPPALFALLTGSILGNNLGYYWGRLLGPGLKARVRPDVYARGQAFFTRLGPLAIVLSPFVPVIRTLTPFLSGSLEMPWRRFALLNLVGSILWTQGLTLAAWKVGNLIPNLGHYVLPIVVTGLLMGLIPSGLEYWRHRCRKKRGNLLRGHPEPKKRNR
ncbi:DedA family protein [Thermus antranikianii]